MYKTTLLNVFYYTVQLITQIGTKVLLLVIPAIKTDELHEENVWLEKYGPRTRNKTTLWNSEQIPHLFLCPRSDLNAECESVSYTLTSSNNVRVHQVASRHTAQWERAKYHFARIVSRVATAETKLAGHVAIAVLERENTGFVHFDCIRFNVTGCWGHCSGGFSGVFTGAALIWKYGWFLARNCVVHICFFP